MSIRIYKDKRNRCDHFSVAVAFINYLHQNNIEFAISELTPMLFRFMADNGVQASQSNVSKVLFYVKNYIKLKCAQTISIARGESEAGK